MDDWTHLDSGISTLSPHGFFKPFRILTSSKNFQTKITFTAAIQNAFYLRTSYKRNQCTKNSGITQYNFKQLKVQWQC